ncbi:MAG: rhodanese-like domain-containing protein [Oligoflexia bacterium]|nr:rhodanese-like domain-containing protein [Oligoflexia bacterium]
MGEVILDVRERDEFEAEHIEHSINVPLSHFLPVAPGVLNQLKERNLVIMCRSGNRAKLATEQIRHLGYADKVNAKVFDGGLLEWKKQGHKTIAKKANHLPILRQVQLVAGSMVLITAILGAFVNPWFLVVTGFFGAGLSFAGLSGFCGLANLLAMMPWNKLVPSTPEELCQVSPKSGTCQVK